MASQITGDRGSMTSGWKVKVYQQIHDLGEALVVGAHFLQKRELYLYEIFHPKLKNSLWCELAPLPGLSVETLSEANWQFLETFRHYAATGSDALELRPKCASAQWCWSQFLLALEFGGMKSTAILNNRLLNRPHQVDAKKITELSVIAEREQLTLKFKLRPNDDDEEKFALDLQALEQLHQQLPASVRWRGDGNQLLTREAMRMLGQSPSVVRWEYWEEPCQAELADSTHPVPWALDESLVVLWREMILSERKDWAAFKEALENLLTLQRVVGLVLKPTLLGSFENILRLIEWAQQKGLKITLSSCYEGKTGLAAIEKLVTLAPYLAQFTHGLEEKLESIGTHEVQGKSYLMGEFSF